QDQRRLGCDGLERLAVYLAAVGAGILVKGDERQPRAALVGAAAARLQGATIELDVHAHLVPINPVRLSELPGVHWREPERLLQFHDHAVGIRDLFEPQRLIDWMAPRKVLRALVSVPPPLYRQHLDPIRALEWATYLNEELTQICAAHPDRLGALHYLPME